MKFKVYYFSDPSDALEITATTGEQACWRFVQSRPRVDTSQVSVEALQADHREPSEIFHYRACDLIDRPEPPDALEARKLVLRRIHAREIYFTLSGSAADLRLLAGQLLKSLDKRETEQEPLAPKSIQCALVLFTDYPNHECYLDFEIDPNVSRYKNQPRGTKYFWNECGRCLSLMILFLLACVGLVALVRWTL